MEATERCAICHLDIKRSMIEAGEPLLRLFARPPDGPAGVIELSIIKQLGRANHFELIGRFVSEEAYLDHLESHEQRAFRSAIADLLGSPYEDRLHEPFGDELWPLAEPGDLASINQFYIDTAKLGAARQGIQDFAELSRSAPGFRGAVILQRVGSATDVEIITTWESAALLERFAASGPAVRARASFEPALVGPVADRRYELSSGHWGAP